MIVTYLSPENLNYLAKNCFEKSIVGTKSVMQKTGS